MNFDMQTVKDIVLLIIPIITTWLTYRTNKKSKNELNNELAVYLKKQDNATANEIKKMQKELDVQNMRSSWESSTPLTQKYMEEIEPLRVGNVMNLPNLISAIDQEIKKTNDLKELKFIKEMLLKIELPFEEEHLLPHELPNLIHFKKLLNYLDQKIEEKEKNIDIEPKR